MIFQELVLTNIGPFAGRNKIRLTPKDISRPIVLFGGLNGAGKTTILESLLLVLYGPLTPASARRGSAYDRYIAQLIHRDAGHKAEASISLLFRAVHDGGWGVFRLERRWATVGGKLREQVEVHREGGKDPVLSEGWVDHVETLAPRGVANLFFFDGEHIEAFAESDVSQELVRTAINGLLGLDVVHRLQDDLAVLERRHRQDAAGDDDRFAIGAKQRAINRLRTAELDLLQELEEAERELKLLQQEADEAKDRLTREGMEQYQNRHKLAERLHQAEAGLRAAKQALVEALGGFGPLLLVPDLMNAVINQAQAERRGSQERELADLLEARDANMLRLLDGHNNDQAKQRLVQFLADDRQQRQARIAVDRYLDPDEATLVLARRLSEGELADTRDMLRERVQDIDNARLALDAADRAAAAVPDKTVGDMMLDEFERANEALATVRARIDNLRAAHAEAASRRAMAERAFERELAAASQDILKNERIQRLVTHAGRARETIATLRARATEQHVKRIQSMVLESLQLLLRKNNLVKEVIIDPDTCSMELLTNDGRPVRPRTLSAGERQLLAVALLAGLARASGRMLPVVIDTPLGRLDKDHRMRFVQSYLPNASHQVIVLSTDTEITPEVLETLEPYVSHTIRLEHDIASRSTKAVEGYFTNASDPAEELEHSR